jgi:hypothetical protein
VFIIWEQSRKVSQLGEKRLTSISYSFYGTVRRIVRNRAAEKAKLSGYGTPSPLPQDPGTALGRHPAYSINGILGIHQPDANANLHKRKRDEEGNLPRIVW